MQLVEIKNEIESIVPHQPLCWSLRKEGKQYECTCGREEVINKLNDLFISLLKGRK